MFSGTAGVFSSSLVDGEMYGHTCSLGVILSKTMPATKAGVERQVIVHAPEAKVDSDLMIRISSSELNDSIA